MAKLRILVIGYNAFDVLMPFPGMPKADSKHAVESIHMGGGGPGATAAVALSKLGAEVTLITPLCSDIPGQIQESELLQAGVNLAWSPRHPEGTSPKAIILFDHIKEERIIFWSRGTLPNIDPTAVSVDWLDEMDMLYTDGHETAAAFKLAREARDRKLPVVMDAGSVREGSADLVSVCSDVISSSGFAPSLTDQPNLKDALEALALLGPRRVALTLGAEGFLAFTNGRWTRIKAFDVPVLDTTGAGDVFHAGYAFALGMGKEYLEALDFGNAMAALKCRGWGGRSSLPTLEEVNQLLEHGQRKDVPSSWNKG